MGTKYQIDETSCVRAKLNNSRLVSKIGTTTSGLLGCLNARKNEGYLATSVQVLVDKNFM
jgi:hypothetical protein